MGTFLFCYYYFQCGHAELKRGKGNCFQDIDGWDPWFAPADEWETLCVNKYTAFPLALPMGTASANAKVQADKTVVHQIILMTLPVGGNHTDKSPILSS